MIPDSVTTIEPSAFKYCSKLESVRLPKHLDQVTWWSFSECTSLKSIKIPFGVTYIAQDAFAYCTALEKVYIPKSVTAIGQGAFDLTYKNVSSDDPELEEYYRNFEGHCEVYYEGSETDWVKTDILQKNTGITKGNIHYNSFSEVDSVYLSVTAPVAGEYPDYDATVLDRPADYRVWNEKPMFFDWFDKDGVSMTQRQTTFKAGEKYTLRVPIALKDFNYDFSDDLTAYINGNAAETAYPDPERPYYLFVSYTFICPEALVGYYEITSLNISITPPKAGDKPDYDPIIRASGDFEPFTDYDNGTDSINGVWWGALSVLGSLTKDDTFTEGDEVYLDIHLKAKPGYKFKAGTATVNGIECEIHPYNSENLPCESIYVSAAFIVEAAGIGGADLFNVTGAFNADPDSEYTLIYERTDGSSSGFQNVSGDSTSYLIGPIGAGAYDLTVKRDGHIIREYKNAFTITDSNVTFDIDLVELLGDVDNDGEVSIIDATYIRRYDAGFDIPVSEDDILRRGDIDGDGEAGVIDATLIQRYNAGFSTAYPIGEPI